MPRYATIDIGTNTAMLLIAEPRDGALHPVLDLAEITRLGRGVAATGRLDPGSAQRAREVLADFARQLRAHHVDGVAAVGTAALRDAADGPSFCQEAERLLGVPLQIIPGGEEARLVALSVARSFPGEGPRVIFDIGGGSTEIILLEGEALRGLESYPVGSVRLWERFLQRDPPRPDECAEARRAVLEAIHTLRFSLPPGLTPDRVFATAGTATTLRAVDGGIHPYDPAQVHGSVLGAARVEALLETFLAVPTQARAQLPGLPAGRADVIVAGAVIFLAVLERLQAPGATISDHGLRHGLWWSRFGAPPLA